MQQIKANPTSVESPQKVLKQLSMMQQRIFNEGKARLAQLVKQTEASNMASTSGAVPPPSNTLGAVPNTSNTSSDTLPGPSQKGNSTTNTEPFQSKCKLIVNVQQGFI